MSMIMLKSREKYTELAQSRKVVQLKMHGRLPWNIGRSTTEVWLPSFTLHILHAASIFILLFSIQSVHLPKTR